MDALSRWLAQAGDSPIGQLVIFVLLFLARVALDSWQRRKPRRKKKQPKPDNRTPADMV